MKCPLKKIMSYKNYYGTLCHGTSGTTTVATVETDFGDCDEEQCFAYDKNTERCTMVIDVFGKLNGGNTNVDES